MTSRPLTTFCAVFLLSACGSSASSPDAGLPDAPVDAQLPFALTSTAFEEGGVIPLAHECGPPVIPDGPGDNQTPPLTWTSGPPGTLSYAIVVRDLDAGNLVHWVVYDLPASTRELAGDVPAGYQPPILAGGKQAELQGAGYYGYLGMCSGGTNSYRFTVHALGTDSLPGATMAISEDDAADAIEAMALASASLTGES